MNTQRRDGHNNEVWCSKILPTHGEFTLNPTVRFRLEGSQFRGIAVFSSKKGWDINDRQMRTYIQKADELLAEGLRESYKQVITLHLARLEMLHGRPADWG